MKFGFTVMADIDEIGFFSHAEALGYASVWVADSQMLFSDCYAVLALAARATRTLRIGPGTAICGTRIRRCRSRQWQRSTGWPRERRVPGHRHRQHRDAQHGARPMRIAEFAGVISRAVGAAARRGDRLRVPLSRPVSMLMHDFKYINLEPRVPLYVSGWAARHGSGGRGHDDGVRHPAGGVRSPTPAMCVRVRAGPTATSPASATRR